MNTTSILSIVAPAAAPAAPMILFGAGLHQGMIASGIHPALATLGSIAGAAGVEGTGALMCVAALEAIRRKSPGVAWLAVGGAALYGVFVFAGIYTLKNAQTFALSVLISLIAYVGVGIFQSFARQDADEAKKLTEQTVETDNQTRLIAAQVELTKAQAKLAKIGQASTVSTDVQSVSSVSSGRLDTSKLDAARAALVSNPDITGRGMAAALGVSPMTGIKYLKAARGEK
jgi:hypothetical protein